MLKVCKYSIYRSIYLSITDFSNGIKNFEDLLPKCDEKPILEKAYTPNIEKFWQNNWRKNVEKEAHLQNGSANFSLFLPPINVTGVLHLGHAMTAVIQDILVRWKKMNGFDVSWIPGTDHAGIATQIRLEAYLGANKSTLGKDIFLKECHKWANTQQKYIFTQLEKLGCFLDFNKRVYTLDKNFSKAVKHAFVSLYNQDLIFRGLRFVNWCYYTQSSLSDAEINYLPLSSSTYLSLPGYNDKIEFGVIWGIEYPIYDSSEKILVYSTRPETILGDVALVFHPSDERYQHLLGKFALTPFVDGSAIKIITDERVDKRFGSGIMKITPSLDALDYEIAKAYALPTISVFNKKGMVEDCFGKYSNLPRFYARKLILEEINSLGLIRDKRDNVMNLPLCFRTNDVVEKIQLSQWFLTTKSLCENVVNLIEKESSNFKVNPSSLYDTLLDSLKNNHEWCLSRQIWWGHSIPAFSKNNGSEWIVTENEDFLYHNGKVEWKQDEDVLDTWFSSALYPLSILNWPNMQKNCTSYPFSLLETGNDILKLWVCRMLMLCSHFTGVLPFKDILFHGIITDSHGRKMSKSLGNVIDPIDVIEGISLDKLHEKTNEQPFSMEEKSMAKEFQKKMFPKGISICGTDALRFALCHNDVKSGVIKFDIAWCEESRKFCNKIWQGVKYFSYNLENLPYPKDSLCHNYVNVLSLTDKWILSKLSKLVSECSLNINEFNFNLATSSLYKFWQNDFCDMYIEISKRIFHKKEEGRKDIKLEMLFVMYICLSTFLRLLHPFMPHVSSELWFFLHQHSNVHQIIHVPYPNVDQKSFRDNDIEMKFDILKEMLSKIRNFKPESAKPPASELIIHCTPELTNSLFAHEEICDILHYTSKCKKFALINDIKENFDCHLEDDALFIQEMGNDLTIILK